ncbi:MAG: MFS transporter [Candidatus Eremiobacteraeota bacterium]|nr:MFS transporter [Candidatus Eremiobacteraeota bacterium]
MHRIDDRITASAAARVRPHNPIPESPYEVLALFTAAMVGACLMMMSTGTLLPYMEKTLHLQQSQLGFVLSVQLVGAVLTTSVAGMLTDRFGDKAVVLWTSWFMGIALIAGAAVENFTWLLVWLLLYGIGFAAVTPAGSHAIVFFFKKEQRGFAMGVRQCGMPIAGVLGSLLLPLIAVRFDYQGALLAAGLATIVAGTLASLLYREPQALEGESATVVALLKEMIAMARDVRLVLVTLVSMALVTAQCAAMAFLTLTLVHEAHYSITSSVAMFTVSQLGGIGGRLTWGWASDNLFGGSRAIPLAVICAITAAAAFLTAFVTPATAPWAIVGIAFLLGFSAVGWFGLVVIALAEIGGDQHSGSALGAGLTWTFVAGFAAPMIFGALADYRGFSFAWEMVALLCLCGIVPALLASQFMRRFAERSHMEATR